jgi:hypothetical protein
VCKCDKRYAAKVTCIDDVSTVLDQALLVEGVAEATHRIFAYRIQQGRATVENFDSDGDHGIGLELLRKMQDDSITNRIWIATRSCHADFTHIGNKRYEHAKTVCSEASTSLI